MPASQFFFVSKMLIEKSENWFFFTRKYLNVQVLKASLLCYVITLLCYIYINISDFFIFFTAKQKKIKRIKKSVLKPFFVCVAWLSSKSNFFIVVFIFVLVANIQSRRLFYTGYTRICVKCSCLKAVHIHIHIHTSKTFIKSNCLSIQTSFSLNKRHTQERTNNTKKIHQTNCIVVLHAKLETKKKYCRIVWKSEQKIEKWINIQTKLPLTAQWWYIYW